MNERAAPLLQHLGELRKRMLRASIIAVVFIVVALVFYRQIVVIFTAPISGVIEDAGGMLAALRVTEAWTVAVRVSVLTGLAASVPVYAWELSMFVRTGLTGREQMYMFLIAPSAGLLFAGGAAFTYFGLAPILFQFLLGIGANIPGIQLTPSLESTLGLLVSLMFSLGFVFQIPLIMLALAKLGIVNAKWLWGKQRWVILFAFILGAALTPTIDPLTQLLVAGPVIILFEFGLLLVFLFARGQKKTAEQTLPAKI